MSGAAVVRVDRDVETGGWSVTILPPGDAEPLHRRMAGHRDPAGATWPMPDPAARPARGDASSWARTGEEFLALSTEVAERRASGAVAMEYGRHLFDALVGEDGWSSMTASAAPGRPLVVCLEWASGDLHRFVWELMHDGIGYLALREATPAVFVRLAGPSGAPAPLIIGRVPHVLFAVGSALDDHRVRAGAEVMGVLREIERGDGDGCTVHARTLASATLPELRKACERSAPDVVHLIGHGRWDPEAGVGRLTLVSEDGKGEQEHTASELADALGRPAMVVVSACESGLASSDAGLPLGAGLVAEGVPIVLAMAGRISDTACRVFTRSVVGSVARGLEFTTAVSCGRRAAFAYSCNIPEQVDWALPAVFLRAVPPDGFALADPTAARAVCRKITRHGHATHPLFAGRPELLADLDALLATGGPGALVLHSPDPRKIGGTRALQELATEAIRLGHVPVRIGPFQGTDDAPITLPALLGKLADQMHWVADLEGVEWRSRVEGLLAGPAPSADRDLVRAARQDAFALRDAVAGKSPSVFGEAAAPLLLLDDVHLCADGLQGLLAVLCGAGLGAGPEKLPVVVFGREGADAGTHLHSWREARNGQAAFRFRQLRHIDQLADGRDRLALLAWMLNPPGVEGWPTEVLVPTNLGNAPAGGAGPLVPGQVGGQVENWLDIFRMTVGHLRASSFWDPQVYGLFAEYGKRSAMLVAADDKAVLQALEKLS